MTKPTAEPATKSTAEGKFPFWVMLTGGLVGWVVAPAVLAAPARPKRVDMSPAPVNSPAPPTEIKTSLEQTPTDELLKHQPLPESSDQYSEKLPDSLPEDDSLAPESAPSASTRKSAPPKTAIAPRKRAEPAPDEAGELQLDQTPPPPTAGADSLAPEASVDIPAAVNAADEPDALETPSDLPPPAATETAEVSEPEEIAPVASASSGSSQRRWERGVPRYDQERPNFAFQITSSLQALGSAQTMEDENGETLKTNIRHVGIGFDYQPAAIQDIGVLSLGATVNIYPFDPVGDLTDGPLDVWSAGGIFKYQAKFARGQWVVPYAGYEMQFLNYKFKSDVTDETGLALGSGTTTLSGPVFGALLLLNWMEPEAAFNLYSDSGIKRSYLFAEWKNLAAGESFFSFGGPTLYFGLRLEM